MKYKSFLIIFLIPFLFMAVSGFAQSESVADKTLTWHSSQSTDKNNNENIAVNYRIVTNGRSSIDLVRNEVQTITFTIESVDGEWANETIDGTLLYHVRYGSETTGVLRIQRTGGATKVVIDFTQSNPHGMNREFVITSFVITSVE